MHRISEEELQEILEKSSGDRITREMINSRIKKVEYERKGRLTICSIILDNDFAVFGDTACVEQANYNRLVAEKLSYDKAFEKLWSFFGFLLAERNSLRTNMHNAKQKETA